MLNILRFNLCVPTPYVFVVRFLKAAKSDQKVRTDSHIHTHLDTYIHTSICIHIHIYIYQHMCTCYMSGYVNMCVCVHAFINPTYKLIDW